MKFICLLTISLLLTGGGIFLSSCAIPNDGQAVLTDVQDILSGQPITVAAGTSPTMSKAQARANEANNFWGGAHP